MKYLIIGRKKEFNNWKVLSTYKHLLDNHMCTGRSGDRPPPRVPYTGDIPPVNSYKITIKLLIYTLVNFF